MARGFFGRRKEPHSPEKTAAWPQLPGTLERARASALDGPAVAYAMASVSDVPGAPSAEELRASIATFRGTIADQLFAVSKDYQILCNLERENLAACDQTIDELRRRLAGNAHYTVLAKLDEVHALVEAHIAGKS